MDQLKTPDLKQIGGEQARVALLEAKDESRPEMIAAIAQFNELARRVNEIIGEDRTRSAEKDQNEREEKENRLNIILATIRQYRGMLEKLGKVNDVTSEKFQVDRTQLQTVIERLIAEYQKGKPLSRGHILNITGKRNR